MSLGEADAKFPGQPDAGLPPSPSRENPGQVFPKSDPKAAPAESIPGTGSEDTPQATLGNPFLFSEVLQKLDHALGEAIGVIGREASTVGGSGNEKDLLAKFQRWQDELTVIMSGTKSQSGDLPTSSEPSQEGGMFTD